MELELKSLDATGAHMYRKALIRQSGNQCVRFQIGNADGTYQTIEGIKVPADLYQWIGNLPHIYMSLSAGSKNKYAACQIRPLTTGQNVRVQIPGPEFNRPYGASMEFPCNTWKG